MRGEQLKLISTEGLEKKNEDGDFPPGILFRGIMSKRILSSHTITVNRHEIAIVTT